MENLKVVLDFASTLIPVIKESMPAYVGLAAAMGILIAAIKAYIFLKNDKHKRSLDAEKQKFEQEREKLKSLHDARLEVTRLIAGQQLALIEKNVDPGQIKEFLDRLENIAKLDKP